MTIVFGLAKELATKRKFRTIPLITDFLSTVNVILSVLISDVKEDVWKHWHLSDEKKAVSSYMGEIYARMGTYIYSSEFIRYFRNMFTKLQIEYDIM